MVSPISIWRSLMFGGFSPQEWGRGSVLHRFVGWGRHWAQGSLLWPQFEAVGTALLAIIFMAAPFTSTTMLGIFMLLCGAFWALLTLADQPGKGLTPIHVLVFAYWCISAIAVGFSPVKMAAASGLAKLTANLCLFLLAARLLQNKQWLNRLVTVVLLVGLLVSSYGLRQQVDGVEQLATWNDPTSTLAQATRVYSFLGNPNLLAAYLVPMTGLSLSALVVWRRWWPKLLGATMVITNLLCLFFTQSRGGWLAVLALGATFFALCYFWWLPRLPQFWQRWSLPLAIAVALILGGGALIAVEPIRVRAMSIFAGREDSSNNFRINVWEGVKAMIRARPIIGIGPGNEAFNQIYPYYMRPRFTALSAYSIYLEILVETGIVGFTCMLWLLAVTLGKGIQLVKRCRQTLAPEGIWIMGALAAIAGLLVHGLVDTVWYRPPVSTLWWLLVAIVASQWASAQTRLGASEGENGAEPPLPQ
ncbi:putative bicarbonate transporter, IctB family [Synechocystis sp. FACHB-383]|uniref:IctB family putative bicarbonate transporter n=1 Tax=Synechocystis sp. FACHB-383 TaxID=2692864 RepID=UPI00168A3CDD|nr:IctB family putative bicarbonate transporter [Synechocystis sp. FACHB-383]MBD2654639.1 putative bicarbonate transporter, IctB family [Synechocystis sp. FACHB-383]